MIGGYFLWLANYIEEYSAAVRFRDIKPARCPTWGALFLIIASGAFFGLVLLVVGLIILIIFSLGESAVLLGKTRFGGFLRRPICGKK